MIKKHNGVFNVTALGSKSQQKAKKRQVIRHLADLHKNIPFSKALGRPALLQS